MLKRIPPWLALLLRWCLGAAIVVVLMKRIDVGSVGAALAAASVFGFGLVLDGYWRIARRCIR